MPKFPSGSLPPSKASIPDCSKHGSRLENGSFFPFPVMGKKKKPWASVPFQSCDGWYYYAGWDRGYHGPFASKQEANEDYDRNEQEIPEVAAGPTRPDTTA